MDRPKQPKNSVQDAEKQLWMGLRNEKTLLYRNICMNWLDRAKIWIYRSIFCNHVRHRKKNDFVRPRKLFFRLNFKYFCQLVRCSVFLTIFWVILLNAVTNLAKKNVHYASFKAIMIRRFFEGLGLAVACLNENVLQKFARLIAENIPPQG